ncbi:MAG TPA: hypothetical protein VFS21_06095 [Roseiflexaceae bacterium]|nr:hypothetical protein [Roseiflexaceae bacterium]
MDETPLQPLRSRATAIAHALGEGWSVVQRPEQVKEYVQLAGPDGMVLSLEQGHYSDSKTRFAISGDYPKGYEPAYDQRPSIRVAATRPDQQIAREINQRLLPLYKPLLAHAQDRQRAAEEQKRQSRMRIERLASIIGTEPSYHQPLQASVTFAGPSPLTTRIDTSFGRCSLLLDGLPEDVAARILGIIAELRPAPEQDGQVLNGLYHALTTLVEAPDPEQDLDG